ncbi:hypothetical protein AAFN47_24765 [Hoeflea sp. CAU 1731]
MSGACHDPSSVDMHSEGPWPFITLRKYYHHGRLILWRARQHRKGLVPAERGLEVDRIPFWQTRRYNWITGLFFSIGSLLFMLGAMFSLMPRDWVATPSAFAIGVTFFLGSIPFTTAGYLQHFQAANASEFRTNFAQDKPNQRVSFVGWHPASPGWLSTFTQFIGTIAFNINTFNAIRPATGWYSQDLTIWLPGMIGSVLFLVSGYLAFIETCHGYWAWRPWQLDWRIVFVDLLGCVFFMVAGVLAYVPKNTEPAWMPAMANTQLWLGGLGFLVGAQLLMRESRQAAA